MYQNAKNQFERHLNEIYTEAEQNRSNVLIFIAALKNIYDGLTETQQIEKSEVFHCVLIGLRSYNS